MRWPDVPFRTASPYSPDAEYPDCITPSNGLLAKTSEPVLQRRAEAVTHIPCRHPPMSAETEIGRHAWAPIVRWLWDTRAAGHKRSGITARGCMANAGTERMDASWPANRQPLMVDAKLTSRLRPDIGVIQPSL